MYECDRTDKSGEQQCTALMRLEMAVQHQRELMTLREELQANQIAEVQTGIAAIRSTLWRGLTWVSASMLLVLSSLIWKRLGL